MWLLWQFECIYAVYVESNHVNKFIHVWFESCFML